MNRPSARQTALPFGDEPFSFTSEVELALTCRALIGTARPLSSLESALLQQWRNDGSSIPDLSTVRAQIAAGLDPLGEAFLALRSAVHRRAQGAVYTPAAIVETMVDWLARHGEPERVVDPGAGSGRFLSAAARRFAAAELVAVECDPLAALMLRANAAVQGWASRLTVQVDDFRAIILPARRGPTAFVGNPPYVRHHDIDARWKAWYVDACAAAGIKASALAGLHLHFFAKALQLARKGDLGVFITAAEWLDVNYGSALRRLLVDPLGGIELQVLEPTTEAFPGTATTAAITGFRVGEAVRPMRVGVVERAEDWTRPAASAEIARDTLRAHPRWSILVRGSRRPRPAGTIELGELFRVHRGQVTGANQVWVEQADAPALPHRFKLATVTRAKELIHAGERLASSDSLRRVIELPAELDALTRSERQAVDRFLAWARAQGAHQGYIARHRKAWWSVGLRAPAPILCTYMGRRPPQFTLNECDARHINIAHGLYPREPVSAAHLHAVARWLNAHVDVSDGRTYAGGLTKFEPKELERLPLPPLENLSA